MGHGLGFMGLAHWVMGWVRGLGLGDFVVLRGGLRGFGVCGGGGF